MSNFLRTRLVLPLALGILFPVAAGAQLEFGGSPASAGGALQRALPTLELPRVDHAALRSESEARGKNQAFLFGETLAVDVGMYDSGVWQILPDGRRAWRLRIESDDAYSISLIFSRFQLPPEGELFVYNDDRSVVRGAYTYLNHKPNGQFAIQPVPGDALTLEYIEPMNTPNPGAIQIQSAIHDFMDVIDVLESGACNIDTTCPVAAPFQDQINATVRTAVGPLLCSGVLLNNTAEDGTQYLLTSQHCGDMTNGVFLFNYEKPSCGTGTGSTANTVQGSTVLVSDANVDFQLARLIEQIPGTYSPFLAGWDRSGTVPTSTYAIHHPQGDEKAICFDVDAPLLFGATNWQVLEWDDGTTEVGSSGCGFFDPTGYVIGCLEGGFAFCASPQDDRFVRMDVMWPSLAPYLDPANTGAQTLGGYDPLAQPVLPLSAMGTIPAVIPILQPGLGKDVLLSGTGFSADTVVALNGVAIDPGSFNWVNTTTLELDFPQVSSVGSYTVTISDSTSSVDLPVQVGAVTSPKLQIGTGVAGNQLIGNAPFLIAGGIGDVFYVTFSPSSVPSFHPAWMLEYGNQFTEIFFLGMYTIPASGLVEVNSPTTGIFLTTFYSTSTLLNGVFPAVQSNLQEVLVVF